MFGPVLDLVLPPSCPVCNRPGPAPCPGCWNLLAPAPPIEPIPGVDTTVALLAYDGAGRDLVARVKYRNRRAAVAWIAAGMAALAAPLVDERCTVTWGPTTPERRRRRGFDHAEILAVQVARRLDLPTAALIWRATTAPQTGRSAQERAAGVDFTAVRGRRRGPHGRGTILLVDDVVTTGATLAAAAAALRRGGATRVVAVVAAATPLKGWSISADAVGDGIAPDGGPTRVASFRSGR